VIINNSDSSIGAAYMAAYGTVYDADIMSG